MIALGIFILIEEPFRNIGKILIKVADSVALPNRHDANVTMDQNENSMKTLEVQHDTELKKTNV